MRRISLAIIFTIIGVLGSNIGLLLFFKIASHFAPIEYVGIEGSLFQNRIFIKKLHYFVDTDASMVFHDIELTGLYPVHKHITKAKIRQLNLPLKALSKLNSGGDSNSFTFEQILINNLSIQTHPLTKPIVLNQVNIRPNKQLISFMHEREVYEVSLDKHKFDEKFILKLVAHNFIAELAGEVHPDGFFFDSTDDSDLKNLHIRYITDSNALNIDINHEDSHRTWIGKAQLSPSSFLIDLQEFKYRSPYLSFDASGIIDSRINLYNFKSTVNGSHVKVRSLDNKRAVITGKIEELANITPYAEGDCNFHVEHGKELLILHVYSRTLSLPTAKISDVQLTYDSSSQRYLNLSAAQVRNPVLLLSYPSLSIQKTNKTDKITFIGFNQDQLQQISANLVHRPNSNELHIEKFLVQNIFGEGWDLSTGPLIITEDKVIIPPTTLSFKDQSISFDGYYDRTNQGWKLYHSFNNAQISFNSQGIIDADTEVDIKHAILNGKATYTSGRNWSKLKGYYDLTNISAVLTDVVPRFVFPLDYEIHNSRLHWENGKVEAKLLSPQGNISITHHGNTHYIDSQDVTFSHLKNKVQGSLQLSYRNNTVNGNIKLKQALLTLNPEETFESFPKDIEVIGIVTSPKPGSSDMTVNLDISANKIPVNIFGFEGTTEGSLYVQIAPTKPMVVTGTVDFKNPTLTLLNRLIKLKELRINYQKQQWLKGKINLSLEKTVTVGSAAANISNTDIQFTAFGSIDSPAFNISSAPVPISNLEAFSHVFATSKQLPPGNENFALLEAISGLKRNQGLVVLLQSINQFSKFLKLDLAFRPVYNQKQTFSDDFIKADITISKEIHEDLWMIYRRQFNEETHNFALNYKINQWLSSELQLNQGEVSANLFYRN